MSFQVQVEDRPGEGAGLTVWVLEGHGDRAEVCPALGFNCFHWQTGGVEHLYATPTFLQGDRPTRSGIPVLFPFPNRIRDGRFTWDGKEYQLPLNDPSGKNAIHGWACRGPWRVIDQGTDSTSAWVTGEFHLSEDAPAARPLWPADCRLRLTCRLLAGRLRLEAAVDNPDSVPLPFGLGYHPYFLMAAGGTRGEPEGMVHAPARSYWALEESLPTGEVRPVDPPRDLNGLRPFVTLGLDEVLTGLDASPPIDGLCLRGQAGQVQLWTSPDFRELVAFTPPHRQAVCLEPYTCTTDAINLAQRGIDSGLRVLPPGERWESVVEMSVS